jgi:ubiquitin
MPTLKLPEGFATIDLKIDGEHIVAPVVYDLTIGEIGEDMDIVAAQMGYWGNVLAAAEEELAAAEAGYRSWVANFRIALSEDPKTKGLADHKMKSQLEGSPQFLEHKSKIARRQRNVSTLDRLFQAFAKKANQLQSRGAIQRAIIEKTGIQTTATGEVPDSQTSTTRAKRRRKVKDIFSREKRGEKDSSKDK